MRKMIRINISGEFVEEVKYAYKIAKEQEFDSIVLAIDTDCDKTYYINDTENGFQCDEFGFYFEDLDTISEELFSKIKGNVVEVRIE